MAMNPETRWVMLNNTFEAYQEYRKSSKGLSYIDLLFVSNFKGGNASIGDDAKDVNKKLADHYHPQFEDIQTNFGKKDLSSLDEGQTAHLATLAERFVMLTQHKDSKIRGFGVSYASALLAMNFPDLLPVLDRRVLAGAGIEVEKYGNGQVKNIVIYYESLIDKMRIELQNRKSLSLRQLDLEWFEKDLQ